MVDMQELFAALDIFSRAPDKVSIERANTWLQDFQHSPEAWSTCNVLLLSTDAPPASKLFAAQTFRTKVTYDLHQVDPQNLLRLRDTLLECLQKYHIGPRNIMVQLCLAVAGLALQLPAWNDAIPSMIDAFGRTPATVPALLQFLTVLPEELNSNTRIPITDDEYKERAAELLTANSKRVLELLSMYNQAPGVTNAVQTQVFDCLRSWLVAGEISTSDLAATPLLEYAFEALETEELFDAAADVICELIHETQEIDDNMQVIQIIVPKVIALKPCIATYRDESEKVRAYARIFTEAGETYRLLIIQHPETFSPILEGIGECSAHSDLDIVPITFPFWMRLAQTIGKKPSVAPLFINAYKSLMVVMINHLHFPSDSTSMASQEMEKFRSFRHVMGDTLKDCCLVLKPEACLLAAYQMVASALTRPPDAVSWQEIEAPLFATRSMGAEVDLKENIVIPKILELLPSLPNHPRVRYAALLIISRYSEWISLHPQYIPSQLQYISQGFQDSDSEVCAAAGQALKYLCQDCKQHLVEFLPTLHEFLKTTGAKLVQEDKREVYEAIAYVISAMPMNTAAESLRNFSLDILAQVHAVASKPSTPTKQDLQDVGDGLENLEVMLHVIRSFGDELPPACQNSCTEAWTIFDVFLAKCGADYGIAERATRVIRHGINLFGDAGLAVAASVTARMSESFQATGFSSYLWIAGKIIGRFGQNANPELHLDLEQMYKTSTHKLVSMLQVGAPRDIPDVLEDYMQMLLQMVDLTPDIFFQSTAFPTAFRASMAALTVIHTDIIFVTLNLFRVILTHDCLEGAPDTPPKFASYATAIRAVIDKEGFELVGYLLSGLVGDFPEDATSAVVSIFRSIAAIWTSQLLSWLPLVLQQLPATTAPHEAKTQFLTDVTRAINNRQFDKVKYAIISLTRASRKARERRRGFDQ